MTTRLRFAICTVALLAVPGCGGDAGSFGADYAEMDTGGGGPSNEGSGGGGGFDESAVRLTAPESSRNFVFIANTAAGTLAKVAVSGDSVVITTVRVGAEPTEVETSSVNDVAFADGCGQRRFFQQEPDGAAVV